MEGRLLSHEVGGGSTPSVWAPSPVGWGPLPLGATSRYARKKPRFLSGCPAWNPGGAEFASSWISGAGITQHPLELPESLGKGRRSSLLFSVLHMVTLCPLNTNTPPPATTTLFLPPSPMLQVPHVHGILQDLSFVIGFLSTISVRFIHIGTCGGGVFSVPLGGGLMIISDLVSR